MNIYIYLIGIVLLSWATPSIYASTSSACVGAGCCCNVQQGGHWPDCEEGYECRAMAKPPYVSVCISKNAPANKPLFLASGEPKNCIKKEPHKSVKDSSTKEAKSCHGEGCCCLGQPMGQWPDCDPGYECRQATQKPYFKVCMKKTAPATKPLFIASNQPKNCFQKYKSGVSGQPGAGHPFCESQPNEAAKQWCRTHMDHLPNFPPHLLRQRR